VLIVDDAATMRRLITEALSDDPGLFVVGTAANGRLALERIAVLEPDVVILDLEMPVLDGFQTLAELRKTHPRLPVVIYSSLTARGARATLDALALGANDYVLKANTSSLEASLCHAREQLVPRIHALCARADARARANARDRAPEPAPRPREPMLARARREGPHPRVEVVAIGTSTGGPVALAQILPALPHDFPVPVVVVQHMPPLFTAHLAERLSARSPLQVREGFAGAVLVPGDAWIAPGDQHMVVRRVGPEVRIALHSGPPQNSCRPAADEDVKHQMGLDFRTRRSRIAALLSLIWAVLAIAIAINVGESCDYRDRCSLSIAKFLTVFLSLGVVPLLVVLGVAWIRAAPKSMASAGNLHNRSQSENLDNGPPCPSCGSATTLRTSRTGEYAGTYFWGCTKYPDCARIIPLSERATKLVKGLPTR